MLELPDSLRTRLEGTPRFTWVAELFHPGRPEELVPNGGLDFWDGGNSKPAGWLSAGSGGGTWQLDPINRARGLGCLRYDRTSGSDTAVAQLVRGFEPARWYQLSGMVKHSALGSQQYLIVRNQTQTLDLDGSDGSWGAFTKFAVRSAATVADEWYRFSYSFLTPADFDPDDDCRLVLSQGGQTASETHWIDQLSILGPFDAEPEAYAGRALTWGPVNGSDPKALSATQMLLAVEGIEQEMAETEKAITLIFSNVDRTLMGRLEPEDNLTGVLVRLWLVFLESNDSPSQDHLLVWQGRAERPDKLEAETIELPVTSLLEGWATYVPRRRLTLWCPWEFADGVDCLYASTTLANGAGTASTALTVDDGTNLVAGRLIQLDTSDPVLIDSVVGNAVTLAEARTWADNAVVRYVDCNHEASDCDLRGQRHLFGGFLGAANVRRVAYLIRGPNVKDQLTPRNAAPGGL